MKSAMWTPWKLIPLSFLIVILIGSFILYLPPFHNGHLSYIDSLFTATSAVCVTGLIVKDTPVDFTIWGQLIILLMIKLGGLGYMTYATFFSLLLGQRAGLIQQRTVSQMLGYSNLSDMLSFVRRVLIISSLLELLGTVGLFIPFSFRWSIPRALYLAIFHSISAFNNAGFSLFSDSLSGFVDSFSVNVIITVLIIIGGIGFIVLEELREALSETDQISVRAVLRSLSVHSKLVICTTTVLLFLGTVLIAIFEWDNQATLKELSLIGKLLASWFHSVTPRTAGFNTLNVGAFKPETKLLTMLLMFIGGAPGGTAGGVKVTTFALVLLASLASLSNQERVVVFKREIPVDIVFKALLLMGISVAWITAVTIIISHFEGGHGVNTLDLVFEVVSAYGTVGLSVGDGGSRSLSALFSLPSKLLIILTMFAGRVGIMTLGLALLSKPPSRIRYPQARVLIG